MSGWRDGWVDVWNGRVDRKMIGWMDQCVDRWMGVWMDRKMIR